jgi:hypothetical protein
MEKLTLDDLRLDDLRGVRRAREGFALPLPEADFLPVGEEDLRPVFHKHGSPSMRHGRARRGSSRQERIPA